MAKNRMVSTSFWSDNYTADLDPIEKLLFLYLLTCERSTLAGVYELPIKLMAVETGIENEMVKKILLRFEEDRKVRYEGGWVAIKNFLKHHEHGSPTVKKGIEDAMRAGPKWAQDFVKGIDTLSPSASASASIGGANTPQEEESRYVPEYEPAKRKNKNTPEMLAGYEIFDDNPARATFHMKEIERESMKVLLETLGYEEMEKRYCVIKNHKGEDGCPDIYSPSTMLEKMPKMVYFLSHL